jgi:hypothetical protein
MGEQAQEASDSTAVQQACVRESEQEAEARSTEQRKQLETMAAAQVEREKALHQAEDAPKQAADVQRNRARIRIALAAVSFLAVVAGCGWATEQKRRMDDQYQKQIETAEQYRKNAEQQKEQKDSALGRATQIVTRDKERDPAKVREFLEWAAESGSDEAKTALRSLDDHGELPEPPKESNYGPSPPHAEAGPQDYKPPASSEKATAKGNKNARFKPLSTASRATFWRRWRSHLAIQVSPAAHRATASVHW